MTKDIESILDENRRLKDLLLTANTALKEHKEMAPFQVYEDIDKHLKDIEERIGFLGSRIMNIERERREERIATILGNCGAPLELVESFAKSGMLFQDIEAVIKSIQQCSPAEEKHNDVQVQ